LRPSEVTTSGASRANHRPSADTVLEIGTGLGYQSAILAELAELAQRAFSIELIEELAEQARHRLARQGHANVRIKIGNGCGGWPEHAPFDKVMVTAAPELMPPPLIYQLKPGGKMVIPAGFPDGQNSSWSRRTPVVRYRQRRILRFDSRCSKTPSLPRPSSRTRRDAGHAMATGVRQNPQSPVAWPFGRNDRMRRIRALRRAPCRSQRATRWHRHDRASRCDHWP